jgi:hypothetical protein
MGDRMKTRTTRLAATLVMLALTPALGFAAVKAATGSTGKSHLCVPQGKGASSWCHGNRAA